MSTRSPWSRSRRLSRTSSASPSPTTSSATSRPSVTRSATSRRTSRSRRTPLPPTPRQLSAGPCRGALPGHPATRPPGRCPRRNTVMSTPATDIVVTGLGATTPLGGDVASTWDALLAGRSGVSRITDDWVKEYPAQLVARLASDPVEHPDRVRARRLDRSQQAAVVAAQEAWEESGAGSLDVPPERIAVVFGTGIGGALTLLGQD